MKLFDIRNIFTCCVSMAGRCHLWPWSSLAVLYRAVLRFFVRLHGNITPKSGRLARNFVQGNSSFNVMGREICKIVLCESLLMTKRAFGLVIRHSADMQTDKGSIPLRLSLLFGSRGLWTSSCDFALHN